MYHIKKKHGLNVLYSVPTGRTDRRQKLGTFSNKFFIIILIKLSVCGHLLYI